MTTRSKHIYVRFIVIFNVVTVFQITVYALRVGVYVCLWGVGAEGRGVGYTKSVSSPLTV